MCTFSHNLRDKCRKLTINLSECKNEGVGGKEREIEIVRERLKMR